MGPGSNPLLPQPTSKSRGPCPLSAGTVVVSRGKPQDQRAQATWKVDSGTLLAGRDRQSDAGGATQQSSSVSLESHVGLPDGGPGVGHQILPLSRFARLFSRIVSRDWQQLTGRSSEPRLLKFLKSNDVLEIRPTHWQSRSWCTVQPGLWPLLITGEWRTREVGGEGKGGGSALQRSFDEGIHGGPG